MSAVSSRVMPLFESNRGRRASPLSTTILTPGMVSDDSAIGVLTTTLRVPPGAGASAACCSAWPRAPYSGSTERDSVLPSRNAATTRLISAAPGRKHSTSPPSTPGASLSARRTAATVASSRSPKLRPGGPR